MEGKRPPSLTGPYVGRRDFQGGKRAHLQRIEVCISAVAHEKFAMCAFFYNSAPLHHDDPVRKTNRGHAMRDNQGGALGSRALQRFNHQPFRRSVQSAGWFVENQYGCIAQDGSRNCDSLLLSAGERRASFCNRCVVTLRQTLDEFVGVGLYRGRHHFFVRGMGRPKAMFSRTVPLKSSESCSTRLICSRRDCTWKLRMSLPSNMTTPAVGS